MMIDQTFLQPGPRFIAWQEERKQCAVCQHARVAGPAMRCAVTAAQTDNATTQQAAARPDAPPRMASLLKAQATRQAPAYCIDAREPGQACGPSGALFKAAA